MSTELTSDTPVTTSGRRAKKEDKKSLWQRDLGSLGKGKEQDTANARIEHGPFTPTLPQVNLLPQRVTDSIAIGRIRNWTLLIIVVLVAAAAGLWWLQGSSIAKAESDLAAATAENTRLRSNVEALAPVKQMYEQITRLQNVVTSTLTSQPQASVVIDRLAQAAAGVGGSSPVDFGTVSINYTGIPAPGGDLNTCPSPDPFGTDITIGCLTFSATASDRAQVSELLRALEADPLFVGPYVTSTTASELAAGANGRKTVSVVAFSGSAGISLEALQTLLTPEQIEEITRPPAPEPTPSPTEEAQS